MNMIGRALTILALATPGLALAPAWAQEATGRTGQYPLPDIVSQAWQLTFRYDTPRLIAVENIKGSITWYWYMTYTVENTTGQEQMFIPEIEVANDQGVLMPVGRGVPASVFEAVRKRVDNPLLESPVRIIGRILDGEANARDSVAIWPAMEPAEDRVVIFVAGLSGETKLAANVVTGDHVVTRKTLMLTFDAPGNPPRTQFQHMTPRGEEWVMR